MSNTVDITVPTINNLAEVINNAPPNTIIELLDGVHVLDDALKPKDGVMVFCRERGGAVILCKEDTGSHPIDGSHNVQLANIALMGHIGNHRQRAWINPYGTMNGLQLLHCDINNVLYRAVTIAPHMRIYDSTFKHIGILGIGYTDVPNYDVSIDHCELSDINGDNANGLVEYGAMKLGNIHDSQVHDCYAHDCIEAFWVDGEPLAHSENNPNHENYGLRITNNIANNIQKSAIHYEISHGAYIAGNHIANSGKPNEKWAWGAGILISSSMGSVIRKNLVDCRHGGNGISIGNQDRTPHALHNRVDTNHIIYAEKSHSGIYDDAGMLFTDDLRNGCNIYTRNNHYVPILDTKRYGIEGKHNSFDEWKAKGQDIKGKETHWDDMPDGLGDIPEWSLNNDFIAPSRPIPPEVIPPLPPSIIEGTYEVETKSMVIVKRVD